MLQAWYSCSWPLPSLLFLRSLLNFLSALRIRFVLSFPSNLQLICGPLIFTSCRFILSLISLFWLPKSFIILCITHCSLLHNIAIDHRCLPKHSKFTAVYYIAHSQITTDLIWCPHYHYFSYTVSPLLHIISNVAITLHCLYLSPLISSTQYRVLQYFCHLAFALLCLFSLFCISSENDLIHRPGM